MLTDRCTGLFFTRNSAEYKKTCYGCDLEWAVKQEKQDKFTDHACLLIARLL